MKNNEQFKKIATGLAVGIALSCASSVMANELDYSSTVGSDIDFTGGGKFDFTPAANSFYITSSPLGLANGLLGSMTGTFQMVTITTFDGVSQAGVSGTGTFSINDGLGNFLTADLTWDDIVQVGQSGSLNDIGTLNLTDIAYTGPNLDLLLLAAQSPADDALSFTFTPAIALSTLATTGGSTSFAGSITSGPAVPDGGMTVALMGGALLALGGLRRKLGC